MSDEYLKKLFIDEAKPALKRHSRPPAESNDGYTEVVSTLPDFEDVWDDKIYVMNPVQPGTIKHLYYNRTDGWRVDLRDFINEWAGVVPTIEVIDTPYPENPIISNLETLDPVHMYVSKTDGIYRVATSDGMGGVSWLTFGDVVGNKNEDGGRLYTEEFWLHDSGAYFIFDDSLSATIGIPVDRDNKKIEVVDSVHGWSDVAIVIDGHQHQGISFANGDVHLVVVPDVDYTPYICKSIVIEKPSTLIPENIVEGVDIFGVVGTYVGPSTYTMSRLQTIPEGSVEVQPGLWAYLNSFTVDGVTYTNYRLYSAEGYCFYLKDTDQLPESERMYYQYMSTAYTTVEQINENIVSVPVQDGYEIASLNVVRKTV